MTSAAPVALVTGASSGIGRVFAERLAASGHDLVLVARDRTRLDELAAELAQRHRRRVDVLTADLTDATELGHVEARCTAGVDLLVNNAGFGIPGPFAQAPVDAEAAQVSLHAAAVLRLTRAALPSMLERGHGAVLNVASVAGLIPGVSTPAYGGTKAFEVYFTECLSEQLRGTGVRALALCPGLTRTEFHERAGMDVRRSRSWLWLSAERVVDVALADLARGRVISIPGRRYRVIVAVADALPRSVIRRLAGHVARGRAAGR